MRDLTQDPCGQFQAHAIVWLRRRIRIIRCVWFFIATPERMQENTGHIVVALLIAQSLVVGGCQCVGIHQRHVD
jgi:hypothetical protein